ncbi:MAG: sulfatase-like hydrolase/transferase [Chitinophagaceae bacterium]
MAKQIILIQNQIKKCFITALLILAGMASCIAQHAERPNIIIIVADDLGYGDLACYGNKNIQTPNIDKLAKGGIKFLDFHSNGAVCSPTRASLLTGKYPQSVGISGVITAKDHRDVGLDKSEILIPEVLKKIGYTTGMAGKWHLGYDTMYSPVKQGFEIFKGYTSGNVDYITHFDQENNFDWWANVDKSYEKGYTTDLITEHSLSFIKKNKHTPFFLYIAHEAPHSPYQLRESAPERGENASQNLLSKQNNADVYRKMIEIMDEGIGKVMASLEKNKISKNTLVLFLSDNGATPVGSNLPYKGYKAQVWEGGHRVPAIAYWKGVIQPGFTTEQIMTMDIFPTITDLVGVDVSGSINFAGKSFRNLFSDHQFHMNERPLFWSYNNSTAIRQGNWKLVHEKEKFYLYDLSKDPGEVNNVYEKFPDGAKTLTGFLDQWVKKMSLIHQKS